LRSKKNLKETKPNLRNFHNWKECELNALVEEVYPQDIFGNETTQLACYNRSVQRRAMMVEDCFISLTNPSIRALKHQKILSHSESMSSNN